MYHSDESAACGGSPLPASRDFPREAGAEQPVLSREKLIFTVLLAPNKKDRRRPVFFVVFLLYLSS